MNRKHSVSRFRKIIEKIRTTLPEATIFTDIIVGFSGEKEEHFESTCEAMEEFKFNMAYIAAYSQRPGAASSRWVDDVPAEIKKERLHRLTAILQKGIFEYNQQLIGKTLKVLVTGRDRKDEYYTALTEGKIVLRFKSNNPNLIGKFCDIDIKSAAKFSIEGTLAGKTLTPA
jgi:tRNA-2-methylthio-N6-dimethylallyladenosine synthase